ncbi:MAG: rod shape-determining protein MreC [Phycisphaerae bacterium]
MSIVALLLPGGWTGKLISLVQIIVPFQHAATSIADSVTDALKPDPPTVSGEAYEALERQKTALEHQVAALAVRAAQLEKEVEILTATRLWDVDGRHIGALGRLIPVRVITEDLLPWRSSRLINAGSLQGVRDGSAVASRFFTIDQGDAEGVGSGMSVLLREALLGVVEQVGTHTARARLLSDLKAGMKVRVGRVTEEGFAALDRYFWLSGCGDGVMQIRDADRRDVQAGLLQVGDMVLSDPMNDMLPAAMTIGKITAIEPDRKNPLLSILTVKSEIDERFLSRAYVYVPEMTSEAGAASRP